MAVCFYGGNASVPQHFRPAATDSAPRDFLVLLLVISSRGIFSRLVKNLHPEYLSKFVTSKAHEGVRLQYVPAASVCTAVYAVRQRVIFVPPLAGCGVPGAIFLVEF